MYHSTYRSKLSYPHSTTISTEYRWTLPRSHLCKYISILSRRCAAGRFLSSDRHSLERLIEAREVPEELPKPALIAGKQPYIPKRQYTPSAVSKREASAYPHSHITSAALTLPVILPAFLSQANSINQLSSGLDWLLLK